MHDDRIEDITCNGSGIPLFLYHREYGNIETNCVFEKEELNKFVLKLAQKADKQLSLTTPLLMQLFRTEAVPRSPIRISFHPRAVRLRFVNSRPIQ
jgi:Type IV secretory pathway, VirB11 components, and related ATPases involved in archaeal flagella biosynthesis